MSVRLLLNERHCFILWCHCMPAPEPTHATGQSTNAMSMHLRVLSFLRWELTRQAGRCRRASKPVKCDCVIMSLGDCVALDRQVPAANGAPHLQTTCISCNEAVVAGLGSCCRSLSTLFRFCEIHCDVPTCCLGMCSMVLAWSDAPTVRRISPDASDICRLEEGSSRRSGCSLRNERRRVCLQNLGTLVLLQRNCVDLNSHVG